MGHIATPSEMQRNFKSRTVSAVWENRKEIKECLDRIRTQEGWDSVTISEAYGLLMHLQDPNFLELLRFFLELMSQVDILNNALQMRDIDSVGVNQAMDIFKASVGHLREQTDLIARESTGEGSEVTSKRRETNTAEIMQEACDIVTSQVEDRFAKSDYLIAAKLVDSALFAKYVGSFPAAELECAVQLWPIANKEKLKTELNCLYKHSELSRGNTALSLLKFIHRNDLQDVLSETVTLLKIVVTTPMMSRDSERKFTTLERIKTFVGNRTEVRQRLNALAMLSIENDYIRGLLDFERKVVEKFSHMTDHRTSFLVKK